jgi:superfamily II DNA or RNA helicase
MRERQPGVYIATPIFDEGVDVPGIDVLILAGGGKSNIKLLQRLGRGMRTDPDKVQLLVLDFIDDTNRYLFKHSEERLNVYEREDFQILLRD